jgi:hypothetical protein
MPLTHFQREVCRLLAQSREKNSQSYIAGGAALNELLPSSRQSRDIDIFHDTVDALESTWDIDRDLLLQAGYSVNVTRQLTGFVEAEISQNEDAVVLQWARDSAFRFFPLMPHPDFGLTLHPFDLATNKILALVGRLEARDWLDALNCHQQVSPLGLIAWAACGKDEGWNPQLIIDEANRNAKISREEWNEIAWDGAAPDFVDLKKRWRTAVVEAAEIVEMLPPEQVGKAVLLSSGDVFHGDVVELRNALQNNQLIFHSGHIGGVWPQVSFG